MSKEAQQAFDKTVELLKAYESGDLHGGKPMQHIEYFAKEYADKQTLELKKENDKQRETLRAFSSLVSQLVKKCQELDGNFNVMVGNDFRLSEQVERLTTTLSLVHALAFADHSSVEYNMEEIRKILNAYDKNK